MTEGHTVILRSWCRWVLSERLAIGCRECPRKVRTGIELRLNGSLGGVALERHLPLYSCEASRQPNQGCGRRWAKRPTDASTDSPQTLRHSLPRLTLGSRRRWEPFGPSEKPWCLATRSC